MPRLEKVALGKQVVAMRQSVRRARLWLVNNLVRQAKRLQEKKGSEQQKAKFARRAERCLQEIAVIKQISEDEVAKFALCNKKNPIDAMKQAESFPVDQRALIRLAIHKHVQEKVTSFREEFPDSLERTILLTKALGLKYQKKREKQKEKDGITEKDPEPLFEKLLKQEELLGNDMQADSSDQKETEVVEEETEPPKEKLETASKADKFKAKISKGSKDKENTIETDRKSIQSLPESSKPKPNSKLKDPKSEVKLVNPKSSAKSEDLRAKTEPVEKNPKKSKFVVAWPSLPTPIVEKREGTVEIRRLNLTEWKEEEKVPVSTAEDIKPSVKYTPSSTFFVGGKSDSEPEDEDQNHASYKRKVSKFDHGSSSFSRENPEWRQAPKKSKFMPSAGYDRAPNPKSQPIPPPKNQPIEEEKLHPSWAAKRAHKPTVTEFQGKKITFED